ncbi:unnamed protein product, partial [Ascophyllum nodosum]
NYDNCVEKITTPPPTHTQSVPVSRRHLLSNTAPNIASKRCITHLLWPALASINSRLPLIIIGRRTSAFNRVRAHFVTTRGA